MLDRLEQQKKLTINQWKIIATANLGDLLDFFDFYLVGYALSFIVKEWHLTYGKSGAILLASGIGAVPGAFFWGWMADRIGRRKVFMLTALNVALATGILALTPGPNGWVAGWMFIVFFRFFVGVGNAGLYAVDLPIVQEFVPSYKRGWVSALTTTMLPAGSLLGAVSAAYLADMVSWRGLFVIGLVPILLVLMIRYWVPESPRWLMRMGRYEEARQSLAWALMIDPKEIELPQVEAEAEVTAWRELFKYPRSVAVGCLTGITQTGAVGTGLWMATLYVLVLGVKPAEAAILMIWFNVAAILGRIFCTCIIEPMGRRAAGGMICTCAAVMVIIAGQTTSLYIGSVSLFFVMTLVTNFFGSGNYAIVGPYMAEIWPARLRASGMGFAYGVGNTGKIIGPLGLALIAGSSDFINPKATADAIGPAFIYFAIWWAIGALAFWLIGIETKGRSIEEIDRDLERPSETPAIVAAGAKAPAE